jgi:hypothetical protein
MCAVHDALPGPTRLRRCAHQGRHRCQNCQRDLADSRSEELLGPTDSSGAVLPCSPSAAPLDDAVAGDFVTQSPVQSSSVSAPLTRPLSVQRLGRPMHQRPRGVKGVSPFLQPCPRVCVLAAVPWGPGALCPHTILPPLQPPTARAGPNTSARGPRPRCWAALPAGRRGVEGGQVGSGRVSEGE